MHGHTSSLAGTAVRARFSVAEIFRRYGPAYLRAHRLPAALRTVLTAAIRCRTEALGGQVQVCDSCGHRELVYHSCRDRHCPTCQSLAQARWIANRMERVLPVPAFHVVFTLPSQLRALVAKNKRRLFQMLFDAASKTLLQLGRQRLGGDIGVTAVLHTWRRDMLLHPHLHCIVTAGALVADGSRWNAGNERFLFPVAVMRDLFRGKFLAALRRAWTRGELLVEGDLVDVSGWKRFVRIVYAKKWVVYAKRPFRGPDHIYAYLGRYTHRVAISSSRVKHVSDERIRIRTRGDATVEMTPPEFIRRFLLHVLPSGFRKIRHYGLYAPGRVPAARLATARARVASPTRSPTMPVDPAPWRQVAEQLVASFRRCPACSDGLLIAVSEIESPRLAAHPDDDPRLRLPPPDTP
jgi:hypothetical protein